MITLETPYGTTLTVNEWDGQGEDLGIDSVAAAEPEEVEEYLEEWTEGQRVRRDVKLRMLLDRLTLFEENISEINETLAEGNIDLQEWETRMGRQIKRMHLNAYVTGRSGQWGELTPRDIQAMRDEVGRQLSYLRNWRNELAQPGRLDDISKRQLDVRGGLYGSAASSSFERGYQAERGLPPGILPAQPGDGTTKCLTHCHCRWSLRILSEKDGNVDANWRLGAAEHCETCRKRARSWVGLRIRGGELKTDVEPIYYER